MNPVGVKSWLANIDKNTYPGLAFYVDAGENVTEWTIGHRCPIYQFVTNQYVKLPATGLPLESDDGQSGSCRELQEHARGRMGIAGLQQLDRTGKYRPAQCETVA